ncbi:MAG: amino acid ABC transporter permease [Clostridia bacterium]|nr:amino acid ABC transporter permease [Clostridia bacterium]
MEGFKLVIEYMPYLMQGLMYTVLVSICAIVIALCVGVILSLLRLTGNGFIKAAVNVYISFVRGTPLLVQIFIIFYALAMIGPNIPAFATGVIALSLNSGGFMAEIIRGGLTAVPKGQYEAAQALGMSRGKMLTRIIFPQVFRIIIPQLTSEFINVIKISPMLSVISIVELTRTAQRLYKQTYEPIPFFIAIAIFYFIICALLEEIVKRQEKRKKILG